MLHIAATTILISVIYLQLSCLSLGSSDVQDDRLSVKIRHDQTMHSRLAHSDNKTESIVPGYYYQRKERLEKRYLRWKENEIISTSEDPITVNYFKPHQMSERVNLNEDYLGFTLYKRNGTEVESNTGIFHFVKSSDSDRQRRRCQRQTLHAGAYRYIYGRCPENDSRLVASGYCHRKGGRLFYNSYTFNSIFSYTDESYYENRERNMNNIEIMYFDKCFNEWKDGGFQLSFRCNVSPSFQLSSVMSMPNDTAYNVRSNDTCGNCDFDCNSNTKLVLSSFVIIVALIFEKLLNVG